MCRMTKRTFHSTYDKCFSSLFSIPNRRNNAKFRAAVRILGLGEFVEFESLEDSCSRILRGAAKKFYKQDRTVILDVAGRGYCWLIALLVPILGFIPEAEDDNILTVVREKMSAAVLQKPDDFKDIFGKGVEGLHTWAENVKKPRTWGGDTEFEVFVRMTGISVHVMNCEFPDVQAVTHFMVRCPKDKDMADLWTSSNVLEFGYSHYKAVVPTRYDP